MGHKCPEGPASDQVSVSVLKGQLLLAWYHLRLLVSEFESEFESGQGDGAGQHGGGGAFGRGRAEAPVAAADRHRQPAELQVGARLPLALGVHSLLASTFPE